MQSVTVIGIDPGSQRTGWGVVREVSGVLHNYLDDCWNWACAKNELMSGARLQIEVIPAITFCEDCKGTYETVKHGKICPLCGSENTYLISGNEINIKEIEAL